MLDGFPRTIREAVGADRATRDAGGATDAVVFLDLPRSELIRRLENRATESGRVDDRHETIVRNRMREYETRTAPLRDYYAVACSSWSTRPRRSMRSPGAYSQRSTPVRRPRRSKDLSR